MKAHYEITVCDFNWGDDYFDIDDFLHKDCGGKVDCEENRAGGCGDPSCCSSIKICSCEFCGALSLDEILVIKD